METPVPGRPSPLLALKELMIIQTAEVQWETLMETPVLLAAAVSHSCTGWDPLPIQEEPENK